MTHTNKKNMPKLFLFKESQNFWSDKFIYIHTKSQKISRKKIIKSTHQKKNIRIPRSPFDNVNISRCASYINPRRPAIRPLVPVIHTCLCMRAKRVSPSKGSSVIHYLKSCRKPILATHFLTQRSPEVSMGGRPLLPGAIINASLVSNKYDIMKKCYFQPRTWIFRSDTFEGVWPILKIDTCSHRFQ